MKKENILKGGPKLSDYSYHLADEKIAKHPLDRREESKLLVYHEGEIIHNKFSHIADRLPKDCTLFFNNTKVIPARIIFYKETGAKIEIFLLSPTSTSSIAQAMEAHDKVTWKCMIGNAKKWKNQEILHKQLLINGLNASISIKRLKNSENLVEFSWDPNQIIFCDIIEAIGKVPLPPYIKREVTDNDKPRYQTVYSRLEGAVAAPTAGLHFTQEILNELQRKNISKNFLTLHVGAGTFQPIKDENILDHPMHEEQIIINKNNIESLLKTSQVIAVGTTSMRSLESLYWYGVKLIKIKEQTFFIDKLFPYQFGADELPDRETSLKAILTFMDSLGVDEITGRTEIFIFPGYGFKVCDGLITNYHQPGSTLILLVAAFIGEDWRKVYQEAIDNDYRFLSYGDSSLLLPNG